MLKRLFDILFSFVGVILLFPLLFMVWLLACLDTNSFGLFLQKRVGKYGKLFTIYKLRTLHKSTTKISKIGVFLRKHKLDELPQLINVLIGDMSIVGPRPDIIGYYDTLQGEARNILQLKPGLTSEAALKYANEEELLEKVAHPKKYNDEVIFPDKVQLNLAYYYHHTFWGDLQLIWKTIIVVLK
jgi:lipopolysaccharide/colanic/teichoic acid biosynthesis glycosyltransferase